MFAHRNNNLGVDGFKINRPLSDYEKDQYLDVKRRASDLVHYDGSIIKLNDTFVEYVDMRYDKRGELAFVGCAASLVLIFGMFGILWGLFLGDMWSLLILAIYLALFIFPLMMIRYDAFTYTHYPIRFNHKNRQVYVFRRDGTTFKAGWDDLYWTLYNTQIGVGGGSLNIVGHALSKDNLTIEDTIALKNNKGEEGRQQLLQYFEFIRRYMEQGAEPALKALESVVPLMMMPPLDKERESWNYGWQVLTAASTKGFPLMEILGQVWIFPASLFRWIVMRTSKIPQWPQWMEDECAIAPNDPWVREGSPSDRLR